MSEHKVALEEGAVSLKGKTFDGKSYELTGDVEKVVIVCEEAFEEYNTYTGKKVLWGDKEYWLKFKIKDDPTGSIAYKIQMETVTVSRSARILADDRTAAAYEAARVRCGAPEKAKMRLDHSFSSKPELTVENLDEPNPIMVEFYWKEEVVK